MDWLGFSPGPLIGWILSPGMDWGGTISLNAWMGAGLTLSEAGLSLFGMGQSHHGIDLNRTQDISFFLHYLCGPGLGLYM